MSLLGFLEHFSLGKADTSELEGNVSQHTESGYLASRNMKQTAHTKGLVYV